MSSLGDNYFESIFRIQLQQKLEEYKEERRKQTHQIQNISEDNNIENEEINDEENEEINDEENEEIKDEEDEEIKDEEIKDEEVKDEKIKYYVDDTKSAPNISENNNKNLDDKLPKEVDLYQTIIKVKKTNDKLIEIKNDKRKNDKIKWKKHKNVKLSQIDNKNPVNGISKRITEEQREEAEVENLMACQVPMIDKIYCLNLESCKERKTHMKKQFKKKHWNAIFMRGIHPRHPEYRKKYGNPGWIDQTWDKPRCFCLKKCDHKTRRLRPTEVAISMSYYHVYKRMIEKENKWAMICEDDLIFVKNFSEILIRVIPVDIWESDVPHIIWLGGASDNIGLKIHDPENFTLEILPQGCYSNYCYLMNYAAAKFLSKKVYPVSRPDDSLKRHWIARGDIVSYRVKPSMVAELSAGINMKAVYNRWSRGKAPPAITGDSEVEYNPLKIEEDLALKKEKRLIVFNKTRYTVLKKDKEKLEKERKLKKIEKKMRKLKLEKLELELQKMDNEAVVSEDKPELENIELE